MLKVYVAGPYRCSGKCGVDLDHMRTGLNMGMDVLLAGYSAFIPWFDFLMKLVGRGAEIETKHFQAYCMEWLKVSDIVLVLPGWSQSSGTKAEIAVAEELGIPVVYSFEELSEKFPTGE